MLRKLALSSALVFAAGLAVAQDSQTPAQEPQKPAIEKPARTSQPHHEAKARLTAEVVSTDATAKTITVRNATVTATTEKATTGTSGALTDIVTLPVEGKAVASLKSMNAGDKVRLTCVSGHEGGVSACKAVIEIDRFKAPAK